MTVKMEEQEGDPILYIVLEDVDTSGLSKSSPQYTRPMVQVVLTLMGIKTRYAHKITQRLFKRLEVEAGKSRSDAATTLTELGVPKDNRRVEANGTPRLEMESTKDKWSESSRVQNGAKVSGRRKGQPYVNGQVTSFDSGALIVEQEGNREGAERDTSMLQKDEDTPLNLQLRTPSFHARLRKGKWLANVPGPDAFENGASELGGDQVSPTNAQGVEREENHKVHFEGLSPEPAAAKPPPNAESSESPSDGETAPHWEILRREGGTIWMRRADFEVAVCSYMREFGYTNATQRQDFQLACRVRERRTSVTVLLCGTSGCGKSTLAALLASRLGITTVVSTDSIRHMMRSFVSQEQNPLLWASTYHAGECLDPAVISRTNSLARTGSTDAAGDEEGGGNVTQRLMTIKGYKAQSEMVIESLDRLVSSYEARGESLVIEGVHLSLNFVMGLMARHSSIVPFLVYISNEAKHLERMAVRAKYMTLDPGRNKYVKYMRNIRTIQDYLRKRADKHLVPKVNNTNVDKSVAAIHATVFSSLRRREAGEPLLDAASNTARVVFAEYEAAISQYSTISSKGMLRLIRRKGSSRSLLAALHEDNPLPSPAQPPPETCEWPGSTSWGGGAPAFEEVAQGSGRIGSAGSSLGRSVERALMYGLENGGRVGESEDEEEAEEGGVQSPGEGGELSDEPAEQGGEPEEGSVDGSTVASDEDASNSGGGEDPMYQDTWAGGKGSGRPRVRLSTLAEQAEDLRLTPGEINNLERGDQVEWGRRRSSPMAVPGLDGEGRGLNSRGRSPGKSGSEWRRSQSARGRNSPSNHAMTEGGSMGSSPMGPAL